MNENTGLKMKSFWQRPQQRSCLFVYFFLQAHFFVTISTDALTLEGESLPGG